MLLVNKLTKPGDIKRLELHLDTVRIVLSDGTEHVYTNNKTHHIEQSDYGCLDAQADMRRDAL